MAAKINGELSRHRASGRPTIFVACAAGPSHIAANSKRNMMIRLMLAAAIGALLACQPAVAASVVKSYSYFTSGGTTVDEIEKELKRRGPQVKTTGLRHPGATRMEFTSRVGYAESGGRCSVVEATVTVKANMILPRWKRRKAASSETRLIWDTLAADIKRHEESHIVIAKNHARELEEALKTVQRQRGCARAQEKVKEVTARILAQHDREQDRFDMIEGKNFESRLMRLLQYRIERIESGRLAYP
jgi:predicted secreted Zn-dependent protease